MPKISSPWLYQLKRERKEKKLNQDAHATVVVVGGGIAGMCTAYFLLKNTRSSVLLLEAHRVAHGATGHNAGQIASYFEKPFADIVKEFGFKMASEGQSAIESAWNLLEEIYKDAKLKTPFWSFPGYAGCRSYEEVLYHLKDIAWQQKSGSTEIEKMLIAESAPFLRKIPRAYRDCFTLAAHRDVLNLLQTNDHKFQATLIKRKGCLNSATFTEELAGYLIAKYKDRFELAEQSPVSHVILREKSALLTVNQHVVVAKKVVLCTNGFEKFSIVNTAGEEIDSAFHHMVRGAIGYMAGYLDKAGSPPTAISYLPDHDKTGAAYVTDPYFYLTRRPFEEEGKRARNLICIGGPEVDIEDTNEYDRDMHKYPAQAQKDIDAFLHKSYAPAPKGKINYKFRWHGLMGYTPNGIRRIGPEPRNSVLLYNLGCNGVGILPSIYGGSRIAQIIAGRKVGRSIFDPKK
ncbi:MAG: FAD-binding oxidoreductase [Candidatus Magasanikbacteria bacterium]|nr:FAD-binding oxidoreductase [Candidatus Magasanikbacteria bacterium]